MKKIISMFVAVVMLVTCMAGISVFAAEVSVPTAETRTPSGFMVLRSGVTAVSISWRNPKTDDIKKISVYDVTTAGTETLIADSDGSKYDVTASGAIYTLAEVNAKYASNTYTSAAMKTGSGEGNHIILSGLNNATTKADTHVYKYRIAIEYNNGDTYSEESISRKINTSVTNWSEGANRYPHYGAWLTDDAYQGQAALYVHVNHAVNAVGSTYQNFKPAMKSGVTLDSTKTYRFSYYYKSAGDTMQFQTYTGSNASRVLHSTPVADWTYDNTHTSAPGNGFAFYFEREHEGIFIDNVEVREVLADDATAYDKVDTDGKKLGENLLLNGTFEDEADLGKYDVEFAEVSRENGGTKISWSALDTAKVSSVEIYEIDEDKNYCANVIAVPASATSVTLNTAPADKYMIKTISKSGMESDGVVVSDNIAPSGFMAVRQGVTVLSVSWRNPLADNIKKISVYDVTSAGNEFLVADSAGNKFAASETATYSVVGVNAKKVNSVLTDNAMNTGSGESNYIVLKGQNNSTTNKATHLYKYRIVIEYNDGEIYSEECASKKTHASSARITNWTEYITGDYPHYDIGLTNDAYAGNTALYVHVNHAVNAVGSTYQRFEPKMTVTSLDTTKTYRLSYYYKSAGDTVAYQTYTGTNNTRKLHDQAATDWTYDYDERVPDGANKFIFYFEREHEGLYFDNIEVREVLAADAEIPTGGTTAPDGTKLGVNLVLNGTFEVADDIVTAEVTNASAKSQNGTTTVTWDAITDTTNIKAVKVYKKYKTHFNPVKVASATENTLTFAADGASEYILKTVNKNGIESAGVTVPVQMAAAEYSDIALTFNQGTYTAKVTFTNNKLGADFTPVFILAVYSEDGSLESVTLDKDTAIDEGEAKELTLSIGLDPETSYCVKAFLWEGFDTMNPYTMAMEMVE